MKSTEHADFDDWWSTVSRTWGNGQSYREAAEQAFRAGQGTRPTVSAHETTKNRLRGLCMAIIDCPSVAPLGIREAAEDNLRWLVYSSALVRFEGDALAAERARGAERHVMAAERFGRLADGVLKAIASGGTLAEVIEVVADACNECDHYDEENEALFGQARERVERQEPPLLAAGVVTKRIDRGDGASETSYYAIGPKRAHYHEALADVRALGTPGAGEQGQEPEGLRAAVEGALADIMGHTADCRDTCDEPRCTEGLRLESLGVVLAALSRFRWQAAAEELRLRKALERAELSVGTEAVTESEYQGFVRCRECGHSLRKIDGGCLSHAADCTFAALAQSASADAEALDELVGTPERWIKEAASWAEHFDHEPLNEEASGRARCAGELRALLRRLGLEPAA